MDGAPPKIVADLPLIIAMLDSATECGLVDAVNASGVSAGRFASFRVSRVLWFIVSAGQRDFTQWVRFPAAPLKSPGRNPKPDLGLSEQIRLRSLFVDVVGRELLYLSALSRGQFGDVRRLQARLRRKIAATKAAADWAHDHGLYLEAELGEVGGKGVHAPGIQTDPAEAAAFVAATGVDVSQLPWVVRTLCRREPLCWTSI